MNDSQQKAIPGLVGLCILLWLAGLVFTGIGIWLLLRGLSLYGLLAVLIGGLSGAAGAGLYRRKKWGVVLFGLVGLLGSINHLAGTFYRNANLAQADLAQVIAALFSIVLAILIPVGLIYLILLLWRRL